LAANHRQTDYNGAKFAGRFFLAPHPEQKLYHHTTNEIQATKDDKEQATSGDVPPGTNWLGLGKHAGPDAFPTFFRSPLISLGVHD
jgi:hypothetical protein